MKHAPRYKLWLYMALFTIKRLYPHHISMLYYIQVILMLQEMYNFSQQEILML
jgi:hypothetical protein